MDPPPTPHPAWHGSLYDNASCVVAGLTADANLLVNHARVSAQRYLYQYGEQMPLEQLVKEVCNYKQVRTRCVYGCVLSVSTYCANRLKSWADEKNAGRGEHRSVTLSARVFSCV